MSIKSGRYIITHAEYCNLTFLSDSNDGTSLLGCLEQDLPGEEWNIKELRNGRYSITNFGNKMSASAEFHAKKGDHVVGREADWVWFINEHDSEGRYTISTANGKLRWFLEDDWHRTPISLNDAPPSDPRCHWTFQEVGRVNTTPIESAKEEVELLKAELARKTAEVEVARGELARAEAAAAENAERREEAESKASSKAAEAEEAKQAVNSQAARWREELVQFRWETIQANSKHESRFRSVLAQLGPNRALLWAAQYGDDAAVPLILEERYVDVNCRDGAGQTPLFCAATHGHHAVVQLLLEQEDVDVNSKTRDDLTALYVAASRGHNAVVQLLLAHEGVDVDYKVMGDSTPLWNAASEGHAEVVGLLLAQDGVDVNFRSTHGITPLYIAVTKGREAVVRLLLGREDVDVNVMDNTGQTPLMQAERHWNKAMAKLLRGKIIRMGNTK